MTTNHGTDASKDDSLMAQANEQLEREQLQNQKPTLATYRTPRRVVPFGISPSYLRTGCQQMLWELYQNWRDAIIERFDLDRQSFQPLLEEHGDYLSIIIPDQNLADQTSESMGVSTEDAHYHLVGRHGDGLKLASLGMATRRRFGFLYCGTISENQVDRVDGPCPRHGKPSLPCGEGPGGGDRISMHYTSNEAADSILPLGVISLQYVKEPDRCD